MLLFLPSWLERRRAEAYSPLRCLRAAFRAGEGVTHRDLLGSLTALGAAREKLGDIVVGDDGADVVVLETLADFLLQNWERAGKTALEVKEICLRDIRTPQVRTQLRQDTVASLRLDAVCAAGFHLSRSRAGEQIAAGRVRVNGQVCCKADRQMAPGEHISLRGRGKVQLTWVGGPTKKGRIPVALLHYL